MKAVSELCVPGARIADITAKGNKMRLFLFFMCEIFFTLFFFSFTSLKKKKKKKKNRVSLSRRRRRSNSGRSEQSFQEEEGRAGRHCVPDVRQREQRGGVRRAAL